MTQPTHNWTRYIQAKRAEQEAITPRNMYRVQQDVRDIFANRPIVLPSGVIIGEQTRPLRRALVGLRRAWFGIADFEVRA